ncbi:MAG: PocR ligand-binding domain-containing protein, partial [Pseudomonadota bacterium]
DRGYLITKDGSKLPVEMSVAIMKGVDGEPIGFVGITTDITERKRAEEALRESEGRVRAKLDALLLPEGDIGTLELADIFDIPAIQRLMDDFFTVTHFATALLDLQGKVLVATGWQDICTKFHRVHPETAKHCAESDTLLTEGVEPGAFKKYRCKNNMLDIVTPITMDGKHVGNLFLGQFLFEDEPLDYELFRDQARRYGFDEQEYIAAYERVPRWSREKVDALISFYMKLAELISKLSHGNIKLARTLTERDRFMESLRESESRYRNLIENAPDVIYSLAEDGSITSLNPAFERITGWSCSEWLGKPFMTLIHPSDLPLAIESFKQSLGGKKQPPYELRVLSKSGEYLVGEFTSTPLMEKGKVKGEFGIARDITERKQAEEKLKDTLESLRKAVNTTIQVMVAAVETRDPYTAGHQIRSANLARAIATEMGLPQEKIDAIRMAGSIHDIGKLSIPAEILSKPTKLSEIEFSLIKEHARRGFEMLKDVESLWPLAEIVHQHHERMDGSGYPGNLKGDAILIEARILAVADVAEAMASHRPYRPGMGIDAALNEIEKNRGILYDNAVADACLRLFREKGFQLEGT